MSPRKRTITILASAAALLVAVGAALALPGRMERHCGAFGEFGFGHGIGRALADLDLTEDQKSQVKAILKDEGPHVEPLVDDLLRARKELSEAVHAGEFDEKAVRAAAAGQARAQAELAVARARVVSRFRAVLTPEQQDRLDALHQRFEERIEKRVGLGRSIWHERAADFIDAL